MAERVGFEAAQPPIIASTFSLFPNVIFYITLLYLNKRFHSGFSLTLNKKGSSKI